MIEDGRLILTALEAALAAPEVWESTRKTFDQVLRSPRLHSLYRFLLGSFEREEDKREVRREFANIMTMHMGQEVDTMIMESYYGPLINEGGPTGDPKFGRTLRGTQSLQRPLQDGFDGDRSAGRVLGSVNGIRVCAVPEGWTAFDGGIYVGEGSGSMPCSIFREAYSESISISCAGQVLDGRPIYVNEDEFEQAADVIERFGVKPTPEAWTWKTCQVLLRGALTGCVPVSFVGVVLKMVIRNGPGHLGNICRLMPCCARKHFRQVPVELLPICLPDDTKEEARVLKLLIAEGRPKELSKDEQLRLAELSRECGADSWLWVTIAMVNAMFCGGSRPLGKVLPHPEQRTADQQEVIERLRSWSKIWTEGDQAQVDISDWEKQSQSLGDIYTGSEVQKAYKLTWKAIAPHVPKPGEAGRVSLEEVVDPELRDFVNEPSLLRVPDDDLENTPMSAPVLVESDREFDLIVTNLVRAGMLEREVYDETLKVRGMPVYNGLFGVHKSWVCEENGQWSRTLRLIVNLIPGNHCQRRMPLQASKRMGYAPMWGTMVLLEDEVIMAYGEDIKHCFHIFAPGPKWRGYFVLSKKASGHCFQDGCKQPGRARVRSAPMGWCNIVDFVQSALERMGTLSGIPSSQVVRMGEPSPFLSLTCPRSYHSFYVDNYDGFTVIAQTDVGRYEGKASDAQLHLRETFKVWNIERDEKKSAEGTLEWSSLGAEQLGTEGLVGSSRKFRRAVLGATICLLQRDVVATNDQELMSLVGKHMHSVQYCRPLACCFDELYKGLSVDDARVAMPFGAVEELLMLTGLLPLHWCDQRAALNHTVYATDASPEGGGACESIGLSTRGRAKCHLLASELDDQEGGSCDPVLVIEVFGGIGGLRKALELIGILPQGIILIDSDPLCLKLAKRHCAYVITVDNVNKVNFEMVRDWRRQFPRASKVILGGGWPCINHSSLNKNRQGADAASSRLLEDMLAIAKALEQVSRPLRLPEWDIITLYENVVMDEEDLTVQSQRIGSKPVLCEAADVGHCRRPRLFWLQGLQLVEALDLQVRKKQTVSSLKTPLDVITLTCDKPPLSKFLRAGCCKFVDDGEPFFTFARPFPRAEAPASPAGLDRCDKKTLGRWRGDAYRLAPYQYQDKNLARAPTGPRRLLSDEQLRMLGFNSDHLDMKQKVSEDQRQQLIGNTFPVVVVARLLCGLVLDPAHVHDRNVTNDLWEIWQGLENRVKQLKQANWSARFGPGAGGAPGTERLRLRKPAFSLGSPRSILDLHDSLTDEQLLTYMITRSVSHRGTDVKLDHGVPFCASDFCRRSIDPTHWEWKVALSYKWKQPNAHITQLEAVALLDLLRKLSRSQKFHKKRTVVLIDNASVVSIMTKGRTTSQAMRQPLRRIGAILVATNTRLVVAWVKSEWNPADGPSRWVKKKAAHDA